jgi:hypothetical protein
MNSGFTEGKTPFTINRSVPPISSTLDDRFGKPTENQNYQLSKKM